VVLTVTSGFSVRFGVIGSMRTAVWLGFVLVELEAAGGAGAGNGGANGSAGSGKGGADGAAATGAGAGVVSSSVGGSAVRLLRCAGEPALAPLFASSARPLARSRSSLRRLR
jgi:hypothetical protein